MAQTAPHAVVDLECHSTAGTLSGGLLALREIDLAFQLGQVDIVHGDSKLLVLFSLSSHFIGPKLVG